jgi:ribosome biogenesis protein BMS1
MSDIVFMRTWYPVGSRRRLCSQGSQGYVIQVKPPPHYNPISSLLLSNKRVCIPLPATVAVPLSSWVGLARHENHGSIAPRAQHPYSPKVHRAAEICLQCVDKPHVCSRDSSYRPVERKERRFNKLKIPKSIEANLPYKSKPKVRVCKCMNAMI